MPTGWTVRKGPEGTVCSISYMHYKLGYPDGIPEGSIRADNLSRFIRAANDIWEQRRFPLQSAT